MGITEDVPGTTGLKMILSKILYLVRFLRIIQLADDE